MKKYWKLITEFLGGSQQNAVALYQKNSPSLVLEKYFHGDLTAWGCIQDRKGRIIVRFKIEMNASWQGSECTLKETYTYFDPDKTEHREWNISKISDTIFHGRSQEMVGIAQGQAGGNALHWRYQLKLPVNGLPIQLQFNDWMWLIDEQVSINRTIIRKWGFKVAEMTVFTQKQEAKNAP